MGGVHPSSLCATLVHVKRTSCSNASEWIEHPLPPWCDSRARVLILGSMPGRASLAACAYYAHPRNQFWDIMAALFLIDRQLDYHHRMEQVRRHCIALWDVIAACRRTGSLDASIESNSVRHHDITHLLQSFPSITAIGFNGAEAERQFIRVYRNRNESVPPHLQLQRLPSTSPAMASMAFSEKCSYWRGFFTSAGLLGEKLTDSSPIHDK